MSSKARQRGAGVSAYLIPGGYWTGVLGLVYHDHVDVLYVTADGARASRDGV